MVTEILKVEWNKDAKNMLFDRYLNKLVVIGRISQRDRDYGSNNASQLSSFSCPRKTRDAL